MITSLRKRQGLTMVELAITVTIIGVLIAAMSPSIGRWLSHYRIRSAARDVASCFRMAQMMAVQANQTARVEFDRGGGVVRVFNGAGVSTRTITLNDYKTRFDSAQGANDPGFDFIDQPDDDLINVNYNTRGIPSDEQGNPLAQAGQDGQRVFLENSRGEGYWVEVTPVGNVRYEKYKG